MSSFSLRTLFVIGWTVSVVFGSGGDNHSSSLFAQEAATLPENWQQLSPGEFANLAYQIDEKFDPQGVITEEVRAHAASLLLTTGILQTEADYQVLLKLQRVGKLVLHKNEADMQKIRDAIAARQDDWTGRAYDAARAKITLMGYMDMSFKDRILVGKRWLDSGGDIAQVWEEDLPYMRLVFAEPEYIKGSFSVRWEGMLTPASSGDFTFSISPINVNAAGQDYSLRQSMTVTVGGQEVLSATPENWNWQGNPVALTSNEPVSLQVDMTVETREIPEGILHALLYWEGPQVPKAIVPKERLTPLGEQGEGLKTTYTWTEEGQQQQTLTRIDPDVDIGWTVGTVAISADSTYEQQGIAMLWEKTMSPTVLDTFAATGQGIQHHPMVREPEETADALSSTQRNSFLNEILARPTLVDRLSPREAVELYRAFRVGASDKALQVFGLWASRHADYTCDLPGPGSKAFDLVTRDKLRKMATYITEQFPQYTELQDQYLETEIGGCCLPVAYVLAYSNLTRGKLEEWIALLNAKLDEPDITGDLRANWLLARAQAQELRRESPRPYYPIRGRILDGDSYLVEALLVSESSEIKVRLSKERAARLSAFRMFDKARETLESVADLAPEDVARWQTALNETESAGVQEQADRAEAAQAAYIETLTRRRDAAAAAGNTAASDRYEALINAAQP